MAGKILKPSTPEELLSSAIRTPGADEYVADANAVRSEAKAQAATDADDAAQRVKDARRATAGDPGWVPK